MSLDWSTEPFAPLFKRVTDEDRLLTWKARAVWREFLQRCDNEGFIEARRGVRGFAAVLEIPLDVVEGALPELIEDGRIRSLPDRGFLAPNYAAALCGVYEQIARARDKKRKKAQRASGARTSPDKSKVTDQGSDLDLGSPSLFPEPDPFKQSSGDHATSGRARGRHRIPNDWKPRDQERASCVELGLNCDEEAAEFLSYWQGDGRTKADWDRTFLNRLYQQAKRKKTQQRGVQQRDVFALIDAATVGKNI